ncbi:MAG: glutathione S-transferase family protein [Rhodobacteraceae bacterium]|nr:glutathione S-transferase family protein [Paracoccaceae bacterium]
MENLTLYHAPQSRSSRIHALLGEMGVNARIEIVDIYRARSNSGAPDPRNPHPEGKVPLLVHRGFHIRESCAIALYLTDLFPDAGLGFSKDEDRRGEYLSWLFYYAGVIEPVLIAAICGMDHPMWQGQTRGLAGVSARLSQALSQGPWLMGERFTAADILCHSAFAWAAHLAPADPVIGDWIARCQSRPAMQATRAFDGGL